MNAFTSSASLFIHPTDPNWLPVEHEKTALLLKSIGFISDEMKHRENSYLAGDNFFDLIAFLGCSPNLNLTPQDNTDKFCFIRLIKGEAITALTSRHSHPPHCPHCNKPQKDWLSLITNTTLQCSSCGQEAAPWLYHWRKSAGFGRFFIEVTDIYPREAIPQPGLLDTLAQQYDVAWSYFYLHS